MDGKLVVMRNANPHHAAPAAAALAGLVCQDFRKMGLCKQAYALMLAVCRETVYFPGEELLGFTGQIRGAAVLIRESIVDACGKKTSAECVLCLQKGVRLGDELLHALRMSRALGYMGKERHYQMAQHVTEMKLSLTGMIERLQPGANGGETTSEFL
jgi:four helix bundle protein